MSLLMKHFEKQLDPKVLEIWKDELDQYLTDDELAEAGRQLILTFEQRYRGHFPTFKQLFDTINGSKESKAVQEWQSVVLAASHGDESKLAYISTRGRVALHAIGGLRVVAMAEDYKRVQLEKSFITVYCQSVDKDAKTLPPSVSQPPTVRSEEEFAPVPEHIKQQMEQLKIKLSMNGNGKH
ncbi:hypothetical protein [Nostoc sp.]